MCLNDSQKLTPMNLLGVLKRCPNEQSDAQLENGSMTSTIFDQARREYEEEPDDELPTTCEDCGQKKCVCAQLDGWE